MTTQPDRDLITALSREIVADVAPEEADLFDDLVQEYYEDPTPPGERPRTRGADPLGFGLDGMVIAMTPAVTAMVTAIGTLAINLAMEAFAGAGADVIREKATALLRGKKDDDGSTPVPLDASHLKRMHEAAYAEALRYGVSEENANRLADALLRHMALDE